jgi:hypothetical protein
MSRPARGHGLGSVRFPGVSNSSVHIQSDGSGPRCLKELITRAKLADTNLLHAGRVA